MTVKLRNNGPDEVVLYSPSGASGSLAVEPGQVVEVPGELVDVGDDAIRDQPADAVYVRTASGELRAWPVSRWEAVTQKVDSPPVSAPVAPERSAAPLS